MVCEEAIAGCLQWPVPRIILTLPLSPSNSLLPHLHSRSTSLSVPILTPPERGAESLCPSIHSAYTQLPRTTPARPHTMLEAETVGVCVCVCGACCVVHDKIKVFV